VTVVPGKMVSAAAVVHVVGAMLLAGLMLVVDEVPDVLGAIVVPAIYASPVLLVFLRHRERPPLLLVAAASTALLAVVALSVPTIVLLGVALGYAAAYPQTRVPFAARVTAALVVGPGLAAAALLLATSLSTDPVCVVTTVDGTSQRVPGAVQLDDLGGPAGLETASRACSGDTTVASEAAVGLGLAVAAVVVPYLLVPSSMRLPEQGVGVDRP
jgi:hypothetical protein